MSSVDLLKQLNKCRQKSLKQGDEVISEVNKILNRDLYSEKNVLDNLKHYNKSFEYIDEEDVDQSKIFKETEIKKLALKYRLRFLNSQCCKSDFPYESVLKIEHINSVHKKSLNGFKVLSTYKFFNQTKNKDNALLFAPTNHGNYYLIHEWGSGLNWHREYLSWPIKNIETLFVTLILSTLIIAVSLPTSLITYDSKAPYWCAYRIGIFFHLIIFNMGVTAYVTFAFGKNLTSSIWNSERNFG